MSHLPFSHTQNMLKSTSPPSLLQQEVQEAEGEPFFSTGSNETSPSQHTTTNKTNTHFNCSKTVSSCFINDVLKGCSFPAQQDATVTSKHNWDALQKPEQQHSFRHLQPKAWLQLWLSLSSVCHCCLGLTHSVHAVSALTCWRHSENHQTLSPVLQFPKQKTKS